MIQKDDLSYINEVLAGNKDAFAGLVDRYKDMAYTLAVGLLRDSQEAEEATQDAFVKAFRSLQGYKRKARFSTWIYRIVYNECISRLRKRRVHMVSLEEYSAAEKDHDEMIDNEDITDLEEQRQRVHQALGTLPEKDRSIVMLYYFEDLPVEEIARITGLTSSNVKIRLFRARKKLHSELNVLINEYNTTQLTPQS